MHFDSKQERCEFTRSLCALIYNKFRLMTHASPTKIMAIDDELQHAVYTCNILSMQDDRIIIFNSFTSYLRLK